MRQRTPSELELTERIEWLIRLRWLAVLGILVGVGVQWKLKLGLPLIPLCGAATVIAAYNLACLLKTRAVRRSEGRIPWRVARVLAHLQISADLVALAYLLHYSGGVESPFAPFFVFHMVFASVLLSVASAYLQAILASGLWCGIVLLERGGVIAHHHLIGFVPETFYTSNLALASAFLLAAALFMIVYLATSITGRLREREQEVAELLADVQMRTDELQAAYEALEAAEERRMQGLRKVAHELKAPLAATQTMIRVLLGGFVGDATSKQMKMLQQAEARIDGLLELVRSLLVLAHSRAVSYESRRTRIDMRQVVASTAELLGPRADAKNVGLQVEAPAELPTLVGDEEGIHQLVTNLVSNAIRYTPEGGTVTVHVEGSDGEIRLVVEDTGIGMEPDEIPKVFGEFYRTRRAREMTRTGTGLGLAIVQAVVESHGGEVRVESEVDKGTRFEVTLPLEQPHDGEESASNA